MCRYLAVCLQAVQLLLSDVLIVLVVRTSVFEYSDELLVFGWLVAVSLALVAFCFLVSAFFSRAKTAATLGSILFFASECS